MRGSGPIDEAGWRTDDLGNPYVRAKTEAERLAWRLASQLGLEMVSALPSTIVGPSFERLSLSMGLLDRVIRGKLTAAPDFRFTFVDVRDVAQGILAAAEKGRAGQRYLLAGDQSMGMRRLAELAREFSPDVRPPRLLPRGAAMAVAALMEGSGRLSGQEPAILRSQIRLWYQAAEAFDSPESGARTGA